MSYHGFTNEYIDWSEVLKAQAAEAKEIQKEAIENFNQRVRAENKDQENAVIESKKWVHKRELRETRKDGHKMTNWRDRLEFIRKAKKEYDSYQGIMTPYERHTISEDIKAKRTAAFQDVFNGISGEFNAVIGEYRDSRRKQSEARSKEVMRWDAAKLAAELQLARMQFDQKGKTSGAFAHGGIGPVRLYEDALITGDMYKIRAAAETILSMEHRPGSGAEEKLPLVQLQTRAQGDLDNLRVTDEMKAAEIAERESRQKLMEKCNEVKNVANDLGEPINNMFGGGPFDKMLRQVKQDHYGNVSILDPDDPEVTGISWK